MTTQTDDKRWSALLHRDARADGSFCYAVLTTGIYCQPSCASRRPRPENVRFYDHPQQAEEAGFRPCKRCQPDGAGPRQKRIEWVSRLCQLMDQSEQPLSLQDLAREAGLSPFHLHRTFKEVTGLTPRQYAAGQRGIRLRSLLRQDSTVTEALYQAGYGSSSSFYQEAPGQLGMKPKQFQREGESSLLRFAVRPCWLGLVLVAASAQGVCAILLGDDESALIQELRRRFSRARLIPGQEDFQDWLTRVTDWLEQPSQEWELPLDLRGTAFQIRVWRALQSIPPGQTTSYGQLAQQLGIPRSTRAVARACASNPLAVVVPCHRVLAKDGSLTGYRWGLPRKAALLQRESGEN